MSVASNIPNFYWHLARTAEGLCLNLIAPSGKTAATVFLSQDVNRFNWFVWDAQGTGGENDGEASVEWSMYEAEQATVRWGKHRMFPSTTAEASS